MLRKFGQASSGRLSDKYFSMVAYKDVHGVRVRCTLFQTVTPPPPATVLPLFLGRRRESFTYSHENAKLSGSCNALKLTSLLTSSKKQATATSADLVSTCAHPNRISTLLVYYLDVISCSNKNIRIYLDA
jgi:hypothetical protein